MFGEIDRFALCTGTKADQLKVIMVGIAIGSRSRKDRLHRPRAPTRRRLGQHQRLRQHNILNAERAILIKDQLGGAQHQRQLAGTRRNDRVIDPMVGQERQGVYTKFTLKN